MNDDHEPTRLDATSREPLFLREALRDARDQRPADHDLARLAGRIAAATGVVVAPPPAPPPPTLPAGSGGAGTSASGGATAAWWAGAAKIGLAVVVVGVGAAYLGTRSDAPLESAAVASAAPSQPSVAPSRANDGHDAVDQPRLPPVAASASSAPARPRKSAVSGPSSASVSAPASPSASSARRLELAPEVELLQRAQKQLVTSPAEALATTDEHARLHPRGALWQEREVLAIEALVRLGRRGEASTRADAFRARDPGSAYVRRLQVVVGEAGDEIAR